jgi:hypothetical protein
MDPALLSAGIAAGVSFIGLLINLAVARRVRRASADQLRFSAALKAAEKSIREIRSFTEEAEKLRTACWHLLTEVCGLQKQRQDNEELRKLLRYETPFAAACTAFFQSFAIVQAGIPETTVNSLRDLRQQCKDEAEQVLRTLNEMHGLARLAPRAVSFDDALYNTRLRLENLLTNLDRLYFTVLMARDSILVDAWTGKSG